MSFGATDFFGFATASWVCVSGNRTQSSSRAETRDQDGDFQGATSYDSEAGWTCEYELASDTGNTGLVSGGIKLGAKKVISAGVFAQYTRVALNTSNTQKPRLTIEAQKAADSTADGRLYSPTVIDALALGFGAEAIGVTAAADCAITASDISFATERAKTLGATGIMARTDVYGAIYEANNSIGSASTTPSATADSGWTKSAGVNATTSNTAYATGSMSVYKIVTAPDT